MLLALMTALLPVLSSCGAPAPGGMYAPVDAEKYIEGVEHAIFSVPQDYTVKMSSNTLSAIKERSAFSLQCRHSDYYYGDLRKNYTELKSQLLGLYGNYSETLKEGVKVADKEALEARYTLHISGEEIDYVQYFFYEGSAQFYLFTYSAPTGGIDEDLLTKVLGTVALSRENYTPPQGYRAVQNAEADAISFDEYEIYIPDDWILDTSAGQICMRVPSSRTVSTILFHEVGGKDLAAYVDAYAVQYASDLDLSGYTPTEKYILASVRRMMREFKDFKIVTVSDGSEKDTELTLPTMLSLKDEYLQVYTNASELRFTYIEFTASLTDFYSHGSGSLFADRDNAASSVGRVAEAEYAASRVGQYFIRRGEKLYFFTYLSTTGAFKSQEPDALKVVKNFVLKDQNG